MPKFSFVLLYVKDPLASADFYTGLLGVPPIEAAPTFAMLPLADGVMLGLWARDGVKPGVTATPGASEVAFTVASAADVHATHAAWQAKKITITQAPTEMDFGHTFSAVDPDGHRLRVFAPGAA